MKLMITQKIICLVCTALLLSACGQMGPLYIPDDNPPVYTP
ncbi:MAG TPA: hypothetical protein EYQ77_05660 [Methylococcaceae bacterium]|nr:hypothetical protein [Methylococcaceae bacterium]HIL39516.1 hypothetical protein [Methylococcales bacterium]